MRVAAIQAVIANVVLAAGVIGMALLLVVLSSALLPSGRILIALLVIVVALTVALWRLSVRVYSKVQIALRETLAAPPRVEERNELVPLMLKHAQLETVTIAPASPAASKLIRELQLRTRTGASAVGIERQGAAVVNPGPDEELQPGDKVLLLGTAEQLGAARRLLLG